MARRSCKAADCPEVRDTAAEGQFALWCRLHGDLLLDHRLQVLENGDGHFPRRGAPPLSWLPRVGCVSRVEKGPVMLVRPDRTGHALLVLPLEQVVSDLERLSLLVHARTFGEVRADVGAAARLESSSEQWARRLQDEEGLLADLTLEEVLAARAGDGDPFPAAVEFFGEDHDVWRPEPRAADRGVAAGGGA